MAINILSTKTKDIKMVFKQIGKTKSVKGQNNLTVSRGNGSPARKKRMGDKYMTLRGSKRLAVQGLEMKTSADRDIYKAVKKVL